MLHLCQEACQSATSEACDKVCPHLRRAIFSPIEKRNCSSWVHERVSGAAVNASWPYHEVNRLIPVHIACVGCDHRHSLSTNPGPSDIVWIWFPRIANWHVKKICPHEVNIFVWVKDLMAARMLSSILVLIYFCLASKRDWLPWSRCKVVIELCGAIWAIVLDAWCVVAYIRSCVGKKDF